MKNILITGCGYFTKHFVKRLLDFGEPGDRRICIYSRDEAKHARLREEFNHDYRLRFFVGDVRDKDRLARAMGEGRNQRVEVVVHTAALKRIEVGRYDPEEMVKTNVYGTMNVIAACKEVGVQQAVLLSSDKACEPVSPYGLSKALAEWLFIAANDTRGRSGPLFKAVRYGNVVGSTGSVIETWRRRIERGHPISITDPEATRFWMHVDEAIDLVMHTIGSDQPGLHLPGELPAFRLIDLAEAMLGRPPLNGEILKTGLPEFEKKHESLARHRPSDSARLMSVSEIRAELTHI